MRLLAPALAFTALASAPPVQACGLQGARIPVGTPIQELTIGTHDAPTMGFGQSAVVDATVFAPPCHGTLTVTKAPLGFRYVPQPDFRGVDMYAVRACLAQGRCSITGAVVTVRP